MATTTNFGWTTPNDTDLVKDGASAIRTLGSAIDTSFVDLKGGTTGQILSKASNTDLDYTWVTTDDANAIQNAIVDAKGDLIAATANDTPARLAVGNNGETLVADSSTSTGLRYSPAPAVGNPVLNSAFQCWQRGTSLTPGADSFTYLADRWMTYRSVANYTVSRQATGDTTNLPNIQYATRVQRTAGTTNTNEIYFTQTFETVNSIPYAGKTVTLSFYARKGADYSQASSAVVAQVQSGTGTDQNIVGGFTGASAFISQSATLTTTWQRFSYTGTAAATTTQLGLAFRFTAVGTAGAADYFEVTGVQLDLGSVALPFRTYAGTIQGELAACQRYYIRTLANQVDCNHAQGFANGTTQAWFQANIAEMRVTPTTLDYSTLAVSDITSNTAITSLAINSGNSTPRIAFLSAGVSSGLTAFRPYFLRNNSSTSGYIGFGAEL